MYWGLSPALDLLDEIGEKKQELHILLIGQSDARHILKTIAQLYRHSEKKLHFYVAEPCLELIARQMFLISLALEPKTELGLLEKTIIFMDVLGNILVRPATSSYISNKAKHLIEAVTEPNYLRNTMPIFDLETLKYKERDYLETVFKLWVTGTNANFDICKNWDNRLRRILGVRYDSKEGAFDWDYFMRFRDVTDRVCAQEYKHFRETGIAFTRMDSDLCKANLTLAAGVLNNGDDVIHHGYLGDTMTGPFLTYGLDCKDKDMMLVRQKLNVKRATDIIERNLMRMFYEMQHKEEYLHKDGVDDGYSSNGAVIYVLPEVRLAADDTRNTFHQKCAPFLPIDDIKVTFLTVATLVEFPKRNLMRDFFDAAYVANSMFKYLKEHDVVSLLRGDALLIAESRACVLAYSKEQIAEFGNEVNEFTKDSSFVAIGDFDPSKDLYAKFIRAGNK